MRSLDAYNAKRDFSETPEPEGRGARAGLALRYSMQKHDATRLHWDLRLEWEGVLLSWAVTRGPSLDPAEKRLAVRTEDHPLDYLAFEGVIPKGYGAGRVMLFDIGHWQPLEPVGRGLEKGHLAFRLHGRRLTGRWELVRLKPEKGRENWLMIKAADEAAGRRDPVARYLRSAASGRTMRQIGNGAEAVVREWANPAPKWRKPQLATLAQELAQGESWWHELKFDGYRALVALGQGGPRIFTRNGHDWSAEFAPLLPALEEIDCKSALLDGEIVAGAGLQGFGDLQKAIKAGGPFRLHLFDALEVDGEDLTAMPLHARRARLEKLLAPLPPLGLIQGSPVIEGGAGPAFEAVCGAGGEGLIAKRVDAPYRSGRGRDWLKIKCARRQDFVVAGWQASDRRGRPFASLALAERSGAGWRYAGKVGSGFDAGSMEEIAAALAETGQGAPPEGVTAAEAKGVTWVPPRLVVEVKFAERTGDGRLRHAVFLGRRADEAPVQVAREGPGEETVAGVAISSGGRVVYPEAGLTKLDVARYYESVADRMLEELAGRPVSLLRLPTGLDGERFFQRHAGQGFPEAVRRLPLSEAGGAEAHYMTIESAEGLVAAAQMGAIEFHIWGARADRIERPDRMVFDLDPDEGLPFEEVRRAARDLRDRLGGLGLDSWPMVTGGKGVHVVVPLHRSASWETVRTFAQAFAVQMAAVEPDRFTASLSKAKRRGRIFIDWLRNERSATAIAPFSLRAREGAPAAIPVSWTGLARLKRADGFDVKAARRRGWEDLEVPAPQRVSQAVIARFEDWVTG